MIEDIIFSLVIGGFLSFYVWIIFFPGDWCRICKKRLTVFSNTHSIHRPKWIQFEGKEYDHGWDDSYHWKCWEKAGKVVDCKKSG